MCSGLLSPSGISYIELNCWLHLCKHFQSVHKNILLLQLVRRVCLKVTLCEGISAGFGGPGSADQLEQQVSGKGSSGQRLGFPGGWFGSEE